MTDEKNNLANDSRIGHYRIISKIGAGGMGEVYLAEDARLRRKIALKVLPEKIAKDKDRLRRFEQEAFAASGLNHPNILTIFEFGSEGETHFLASEFVKGETLRDKLNRENLTLQETLDITIQIASALKAAHEAGIIHRDIKPENVMIRPDGLVKILDFGIAKLSESPAPAGEIDAEAATAIKAGTTPGMIIGTANYMSPEQARGQAVDARSDIFSFGVVLYEMISGVKPFAGETAMDVISSILQREPAPLSNEEMPEKLRRITEKCLRKERDERYQTAKDLLIDLKSLQRRMEFEAEFGIPPVEGNSTEQKTQILEPKTTNEEQPLISKSLNTNSIAVLPFANLSNDAENEYFCDGWAEELLNALAKIDDLKVAARTSAFSFKNKNVEISEIGNALSVNTILEGSVRKSGNRVRITVQLINSADGYHLWSERYDREMRDIFDVQDEITLAVVDALKVKLLGAEKAALLKRYTDNAEAYELYLKGRYHYNRQTAEGIFKGIEYFEKAIEIEPEYAPAYAWLSLCYSLLQIYGVLAPHEIVPKLKAAASRALEIDDLLAEVHLALAAMYFYYEWDWAQADREYRRAIELNPNNADVRYNYGLFLACRERFDEAISEGRRALELDPLSLSVNLIVGWIYLFSDRLDEVLEQSGKLIELEPNFHGAYWQMAEVQAAKGDYEGAAELLQKAVGLGGTGVILSKLGSTYGRAGKRDEALGVLNQMLEMRERQYVTAFNIARVYAGLGDNDNAFDWLEKAIEERNGELVLLDRLIRVGNGESWGKSFRINPRYQDILRRVGLPTNESANGKTTDESSEAQTAIISPGAIESEPSSTAGGVNSQNDKTPIINRATADATHTASSAEYIIVEVKKHKRGFAAVLLALLVASAGFGYWLFSNSVSNTKQIESIAVLPFVNESGNAETEYLSDGMTETLISSLSQLPNLNVKARSSVFRYKGKETDAATIGKELNVQAILNGRVVQRGQDLILYVTLIDAQTENVLWKADYNKPMANLVSLQSEIARDVSQKLKTKLSGADEQKLAKNYTANPEAYQLYLQGRFFVNKRSSQDLQKAIEYFNQAIAIDPNYALAYAGLTDAYALLPVYQTALPHEVMPKAREAALKALSLDNNLAEAHAALGYVLVDYDYNFAEGEREYRRAIELNPNYATAHQWLGELLVTQGRFEEGFAEYRRALEIEPFSLPVNWSYGINLYNARRYPDAIAQIKKALELDNSFQRGRIGLAVAYEASRNYQEAAEAFAKLQESRGNMQNAAAIREQFAKNGWQGVMRATIERLEADNSSPYTLAGFYAQLGEKDKAFAELNKAYGNRAFQMILLKVDWRFDSLRDDSRFQELLRKVGFPQ